MAAIPHYAFNITGATGTQGALAPLQSYRAYIFPRGANVSQDSTGTTITFDSAAIASRFAANNWVQAGTAIANIRRVTAVGGNSISVNTAVTVSENNRIFLIGNTQPTTAGGSATYTTPNTIIRTRGDDAADIVANSMLTSNVDGLVEFYAAPNIYDALIQDGNRGPAGYIADLEVGSVEGISALDATYFGSTVTISGSLVAGATASFAAGVSMNTTLIVGQSTSFLSGVSVTGGITATGTLSIGQTATFNATISGVTTNLSSLRTSVRPWIDVTHPTYGAAGDGSTNDRAAIVAAIDALPTDGGTVFFPPGRYLIGNTGITSTKENVHLLGAGGTHWRSGISGPPPTSIEGTSSGMVLLTIGRTDSTAWGGWKIENLVFRDVSGTSDQLAGGILLRRTNNCEFINVGIYDILNGYGMMTEGTGASPQYITMIDCRVYARNGIICADSTGNDLAIIGGQIEGVGASGSTGCVLQSSSRIIGTNIQYFETNVAIASTGNDVVGVRLEGIAGTTTVTHVHVRGGFDNHISNIQVGGAGTSLTHAVRIDSGSTHTVVGFAGRNAAAGDYGGAGNFILDNGSNTTYLTSGLNTGSLLPFLKTSGISTASLPAVGTSQNGRILIEDAGTGDRNLIIYFNNQRFRIDGGAAF